MSGSRKEKVTLQTPTHEEESESRDVYLREGRTLSVKEQGGQDILEIRSGSGQVELRIRLTEDGPVLQMESARLQLKATEAVEIEGKRVEIKATEQATIASEGKLDITSESDMKVEAEGEVRVNGKMIFLN